MNIRGFIRRSMGGGHNDAHNGRPNYDAAISAIIAALENQQDLFNQRLSELVQGANNQSNLFDQRWRELLQALDNQSNRADQRSRELLQALDNQSSLLNRHLMKLIDGLDNQSNLLNQRLKELVQGIRNQADNDRKVVAALDNQQQLFNQRLSELVQGTDNQSDILNRKFERIILELDYQSHLLGANLESLAAGISPHKPHAESRPSAPSSPPTSKPAAGELKNDQAPSSSAGPLTGAPQTRAGDRGRGANQLEAFRDVFAGIKPWSGRVPPRFIADFLGMLIDIEFHPMLFTDPTFDATVVGGDYQETVIPRLADAKTPADAEAWFEAVDWVVSAREARDRYVMVTLGANYGAQAVGAYRALQAVNPLPCKLVAVDPVPENVEWIRRHMRNNGIDPDAQWIVPVAISDKVEPLFFPVGGPGVGSNNCYSTNERGARERYAEEFIARKMSAEALRNLLLENTTGIVKDLVPGQDFKAEIKLISSITLNELLGPFETVDLLESDIQQSEILVFPPFIDLLRRKVRRIHIGTHGGEVHEALEQLFADDGWDIVFSYAPNAKHDSALGAFETNDGVLTVRNPDL